MVRERAKTKEAQKEVVVARIEAAEQKKKLESFRTECFKVGRAAQADHGLLLASRSAVPPGAASSSASGSYYAGPSASATGAARTGPSAGNSVFSVLGNPLTLCIEIKHSHEFVPPAARTVDNGPEGNNKRKRKRSRSSSTSSTSLLPATKKAALKRRAAVDE